jgi:hypothetical protein
VGQGLRFYGQGEAKRQQVEAAVRYGCLTGLHGVHVWACAPQEALHGTVPVSQPLHTLVATSSRSRRVSSRLVVVTTTTNTTSHRTRLTTLPVRPPLRYFNSPRGCRNKDCTLSHDSSSGKG